MQTTTRSLVSAVDHATVPSIDLLADFAFYKKLFGAELSKRNGMVNFSIARRKAGRAAIFFLDLAGVSGFGLFLQDEYPPPAKRLLEGPRYGFATLASDLAEAAKVLEDCGIEAMGPVEHPRESPIRQSLYFKDPSENSLELMVWRDVAPGLREPTSAAGLIPLRGICHIALDVTDLDGAEDFYVTGLGLEPLYRGKTADGLNASVLSTAHGHIFTLQQVDRMSERSIKKYRSDTHCAVRVERAAFPVIEAEMMRRKVPLLPDYVAGDGNRHPDDRDVYMVDPFGNNVQVFTGHTH